MLIVIDELKWLAVITLLIWLASESFDMLGTDSPGILLREVLGKLALSVWRYELADSASASAKASLGFPVSLLSSRLIVDVHLVSSQILDEHLLLIAIVIPRTVLKHILSVLRLEHLLLLWILNVLLLAHTAMHLLQR